MPRHRPNRFPKPPQRQEGPLAAPRMGTKVRLRALSREHQSQERPFEPERRGSWRGSARDLVVNPGIYSGTQAAQDDFILHQHSSSGRWYVDLVQRGGTHLGVGHSRGYATRGEAKQEAQREAHRRGILGSVIFWATVDGDLRQVGQSDPRHELHRNSGIKVPDLDDHRVLRNVWLATDPGVGKENPDTFDYESNGYRLLTWDTNRRYETGQSKIGYAFYEPGQDTPLFVGDDMGVAPSDPIDSDGALRGTMSFLTLKPGDTDSDYFDSYTPDQMDFAQTEAEELMWWGMECITEDGHNPCDYYVFVDVDPDARFDAEGDPVRRGLKSPRYEANNKGVAQLDSFTRAYLETALWSSNDESDDAGGEPLDKNYGIEDFSADAISRAVSDCERFQAEQANALASVERVTVRGEYTDSELAGHDFWLTRNGHGAGFWDGDWSEPEATRLTDASKAFGEVWIVVGDDGQLHFM
jgi:hypothetical protein